ncbi:MAG: glycosyltransferase, partial [Lachnospiraceae bacterium]|nr:glycosyltransferase [Lachnospiraceae bacterium]
MKKLVSFVIPCYRSEATLPGVIEEIKETMQKLENYAYEVVLVNDCSPDDTFGSIRKLCQENANI